MDFIELASKKKFLSLKFQRKSSFYFNFSASFLKNPLFRRPG
ncbi:Cyanobacteria-specific RpoD-like sigma factor [Prochlorococcus sp. MIT 0604]|nr:Cyanobacteria-specific RpoD-like sigma factor [Prochlorococcus sp. MIT 0604]